MLESVQGNGGQFCKEVVWEPWGHERRWAKMKLINHSHDNINTFPFYA